MHHLRDLLFDLQNKEDFKQFKRETLVFCLDGDASIICFQSQEGIFPQFKIRKNKMNEFRKNIMKDRLEITSYTFLMSSAVTLFF